MRSIFMRLVLVAFTVVAVGTIAVPQDGRDGSTTAQARVEQKQRPKCIKLADYRHGLKKRVIRFTTAGGNYVQYRIRGRGLHRTQKQRDCWRERGNLKRVKRMRKMQNERFQEWKFVRKINRLTPWGEWAIPPYIVSCESGGDYTKWNYSGTSPERASGAYQIIGDTWRRHGGLEFAQYAAYAPPWAQHIVARRIVGTSGMGAWSCS